MPSLNESSVVNIMLVVCELRETVFLSKEIMVDNYGMKKLWYEKIMVWKLLWARVKILKTN